MTQQTFCRSYLLKREVGREARLRLRRLQRLVQRGSSPRAEGHTLCLQSPPTLQNQRSCWCWPAQHHCCLRSARLLRAEKSSFLSCLRTLVKLSNTLRLKLTLLHRWGSCMQWCVSLPGMMSMRPAELSLCECTAAYQARNERCNLAPKITCLFTSNHIEYAELRGGAGVCKT